MDLLSAYENVHGLNGLAYFPERALNYLRKKSGITDSTHNLLNSINDEYHEAASGERIVMKSANNIVEDIGIANKMYMVTDYKELITCNRLVLIFIKNRNQNQQPWELERVISESDYNDDFLTDLGGKPKDMLYKFACWPTFIKDMKELKRTCLFENWSFVSEPEDDDYPILIKYIKYTFAKLWNDKQVQRSNDGRYAVFNSGLVNRNYKYIYLLFEKYEGVSPWKFSQFCMPGIGSGGRTLADNFPTLPKPAKYFSTILDVSYVLFDEKSPEEQLPELQPDHYFVDHPERLPLDFLLDGCRKSEIIVSKLHADLSKYDFKQRERYWEDIGHMISNSPEVYDDLESSFRSAVRKAVMRVSWNYRTAIPVYFPTEDRMSILLPIVFGTRETADVALVVEWNKLTKNYYAPTILSLPLAYSNARLVCKPESDWLNQKSFKQCVDNTEDD